MRKFKIAYVHICMHVFLYLGLRTMVALVKNERYRHDGTKLEF